MHMRKEHEGHQDALYADEEENVDAMKTKTANKNSNKKSSDRGLDRKSTRLNSSHT